MNEGPPKVPELADSSEKVETTPRTRVETVGWLREQDEAVVGMEAEVERLSKYLATIDDKEGEEHKETLEMIDMLQFQIDGLKAFSSDASPEGESINKVDLPNLDNKAEEE